MARIRSIKPSFFMDEDISRLPFHVRLLFIGLWCMADKAGRLEDRPGLIKATLFSSDLSDLNRDIEIEACLNELTKKPFIVRYVVNGCKYIEILKFLEHQRPHHTEAKSNIPPNNAAITVNSPLPDGEYPAGREGKGREGKGMEASLQPSVYPQRVKIFFDNLNGRVSKLSQDYPNVSVPAELSRMREWLLDDNNPRRENLEKFIVNWLHLEQKRAKIALDKAAQQKPDAQPGYYKP